MTERTGSWFANLLRQRSVQVAVVLWAAEPSFECALAESFELVVLPPSVTMTMTFRPCRGSSSREAK